MPRYEAWFEHQGAAYVSELLALRPFESMQGLGGYNPVTPTLREYRDMLGDIAAPGPLLQRLKHLWAPPEWQRGEMARDIDPGCDVI